MKWSITLILIITCVKLAAQPFHFKTYTTGNGLSSNNVICSEPDGNGFLWIATSNGLNRFDGHAFDHFYNDPDDSTSIAGNEIQSIFTDRKKQLWIGSVGGITQYNPRQQNFTNYFPDSSAGKCGRSFYTMADDNRGNIWVGTWYELLIFNQQQNRFTRSGWADFAAEHKPVNGNNSRIVVLNLLEKSADELWVLTTYGLYSVNTITKQFTYYPNQAIDDYFGCQLKYIDPDGILWIGSYNKGLFSFDGKNNQWQNFTMPPSWLSQQGFCQAYSIVPFKNNTLLYCGLDGIGFFDRKTNIFVEQFVHDAADERSYPKTNCFSITHFQNDYWMASSNGLVKMYRSDNQVTKTLPFEKPDWIDYIFPLGNHQLVVGNTSAKRIVVLNELTGDKVFINNRNGQVLEGNLTGFLKINNSTAIVTAEDKLYRLNMATLTTDTIALPAKRFLQNGWVLRNIVVGPDKLIYIRSRQQGILQYDPVSGISKFIDFVVPSFEKSYTSLYADLSNLLIWIGIENDGVYVYNVKTQQTNRHALDTKQKGAPFTIYSINGDGKGHIFFADAHRGLFTYNIQSANTTHYTMQDGLPSNNCYRTTIDDNGTVWVSTSEGICSFDPALNKFSGFDNDGLFAKGLSQIVAGNGGVYCADATAFYKWLPSAKQGKQIMSTIYLRSISVNQLPGFIDSVYHLSYQDNNIFLQFGALNFKVKDQPVLLYSINQNETWTRLEKDGKINFINLSPGHYSITVKEYGSENTLQLQISIQPPFWKQWWFLASIVLLTGIVLYYFIRQHIARIRKEAQLKQRVAETEMMALRAQMNPHFIFNCISSIDNFILGNDKEQASNYLNKFARLIRNILDNSKNDVVPFWKDWETMQLYLQLESLRANHKFTYELKADDELLQGHYKIPPLIIQPYIENAIHHGLLTLNNNNGQLLVTASMNGDILTYSIQDNGIGRKKAAEAPSYGNIKKVSYGLQLSAERIRLFNGSPGEIVITDLKNNNGDAAGTLVEVSLQV